MSFESYEEIIRFAIDKEKEAAEFYAECAEKESFAGAKKSLEDMSKEERKHQHMLENLDENREALKDYKYEWIPDIKRSNYMTELTYEKGMSYVDILRLAMKREEIALALYNELLRKAEKDSHKDVFKLLCQEEAKHKLFLETLYDDFMAEQGD